MRIRTWLAGACLLAAGCSGGSPAPASAAPPAPTATVTAALSACSALFRAGQPSPQPHGGDTGLPCTTTAGGVYVVPAFRCKDGGLLWAAGRTAPVPGWGRPGQPFHAVRGDAAADPQYATAVRACVD